MDEYLVKLSGAQEREDLQKIGPKFREAEQAKDEKTDQINSTKGG